MGTGDYSEEGPVTILRNSTFMSNEASLDNGGVINVGTYGLLFVEGGDNVFASNRVDESGGVIAATTDTTVVIEGGEFHDNEAYKVRPKHQSIGEVEHVVCDPFAKATGIHVV